MNDGSKHANSRHMHSCKHAAAWENDCRVRCTYHRCTASAAPEAEQGASEPGFGGPAAANGCGCVVRGPRGDGKRDP
eukprot:786139-Pelagomonas_calceolata.AAC.2